jgi:hypothetical protein
MAPIKFDVEFIERRMEQHRRWQHQAEHCLIEEIIEEVQAMPKRKIRAGRLFELLPEHVQLSIVCDLDKKVSRALDKPASVHNF